VTGPDVLIISGSMGAGKTTVLAEASDILCAASVEHAAIDLDALTIGHLPPHATSLFERNLAAVWNNYSAFGIRRLILAGAVETAARLAEIRAAIPGARIVIGRLHASVPTMQERVRGREPGMLQSELLERVSLLEAELDEAGLHDFVVDNEQRDVTEVARELLTATGWLLPSREAKVRGVSGAH
jgi:hypothetical protein